MKRSAAGRSQWSTLVHSRIRRGWLGRICISQIVVQLWLDWYGHPLPRLTGRKLPRRIILTIGSPSIFLEPWFGESLHFFFVNYYNLESSNCCESSALLFRWNARLKFGLICMRIRRVCEYLKYIAVNSMLTLTCKITAKTPETCSLVHPGKRVTFTRVEIHPPSC